MLGSLVFLALVWLIRSHKCPNMNGMEGFNITMVSTFCFNSKKDCSISFLAFLEVCWRLVRYKANFDKQIKSNSKVLCDEVQSS